jgi:hypothetical protein
MEFCDFVPQAARSYILEMINGELSKWDGLQRLVDKAKSELDQLAAKNQQKIIRDNRLSAAELKEQQRANSRYKQLLGDLEAVQRLGTDQRMAPTYRNLRDEFNEDEKLLRFLHAAWGARIDFLSRREILESATAISEEIAVEAESLAAKMRELVQTFHDTPLELHSISELLRQTDKYDLDGHNLGMWRIHRDVILGNPRPHLHASTAAKADTVLDSSPASETELYQSNLRYAWTLAPDFAGLLSKVAEIMGKFSPQEHGYIGAGVHSREINEKTAYIRALYKLLKDEHGFEVSLSLKKAMASVTTVILNKPNIDVTTDDISKTISRHEKREAG